MQSTKATNTAAKQPVTSSENNTPFTTFNRTPSQSLRASSTSSTSPPPSAPPLNWDEIDRSAAHISRGIDHILSKDYANVELIIKDFRVMVYIRSDDPVLKPLASMTEHLFISERLNVDFGEEESRNLIQEHRYSEKDSNLYYIFLDPYKLSQFKDEPIKLHGKLKTRSLKFLSLDEVHATYHLKAFIADSVGSAYAIDHEIRFEDFDRVNHIGLGDPVTVMIKVRAPDPTLPIDEVDLSCRIIPAIVEMLGPEKFVELVHSFGIARDGSYFIDFNLSSLGSLKVECLTFSDNPRGYERQKELVAPYMDSTKYLLDVCAHILCYGPSIKSRYYFAKPATYVIDGTQLISYLSVSIMCSPFFKTEEVKAILLTELKRLNYVETANSIEFDKNDKYSILYIILDSEKLLHLRPKLEALVKVLANENPDDRKARQIEFEIRKWLGNNWGNISELSVDSHQCTLDYINDNLSLHAKPRQIFNSVYPKENQDKFREYKSNLQKRVEQLPPGSDHKKWYNACFAILTSAYSFITEEEHRYFVPFNTLTNVCNRILFNQFQITYEASPFSPDSFKFLRITIDIKDPCKDIQIHTKLIDELKNRLGENRLIKQYGISSGAQYCIDVNLRELLKLKSTLAQLEKDLSNETPEHVDARQTRYRERYLAAYEKGPLETIYKTMPGGGNDVVPKADLIAMCSMYAHFEEAILTDKEFQAAVSAVHKDFRVGEPISDDTKNDYYLIFIQRIPEYQTKIHRIFNCHSFPANEDKKRYMVGCFADQSVLERDMTIRNHLGQIEKLITRSYLYVKSEEAKIGEPANILATACKLSFNYPCTVSWQPIYKTLHKKTMTVEGPIESVMLMFSRTNGDTIDKHEKSLIALLGNDAYSASVEKYDRSKKSTYITADEKAYFFKFKPTQLMELNTSGLIPLSPTDLEMYSNLCGQLRAAMNNVTDVTKIIEYLNKIPDDINNETLMQGKKWLITGHSPKLRKSEGAIEIYNDLLAIYEPYVKFFNEFNNESTGLKARLIEQLSKKGIDNVTDPLTFFEEYLLTTPHWHPILRGIFQDDIGKSESSKLNKWQSFLAPRGGASLTVSQRPWYKTLENIAKSCFNSALKIAKA